MSKRVDTCDRPIDGGVPHRRRCALSTEVHLLLAHSRKIFVRAELSPSLRSLSSYSTDMSVTPDSILIVPSGLSPS